MRGNAYKKYRREPPLKIGSKAENILYSEKNINPDLNFFNKQLSEEEYLSNKRKIYQKEEFSTLSKNFQDNYMGPPNLAHQRIDFDNVSGKIGQERREQEISKYQSQPSFAKDQVYNTYINNDRERNNKKYYHNIINNTIFGFCDPGMKYPKTSYQSNFRGNDINEQLKYLSKRQYEDYLQFRKEQIELMTKGNLGKNLRELPPRKRKEEQINYQKNEMRMGERELREKRIKEEADNLMKEQRLLDQNQVRTFNPNGYIPTPEEYENYLKQQKENALKEFNNKNYNYDIPPPNQNQFQQIPQEKIENQVENIRRKTPLYQNENINQELPNNDNNINNNPIIPPNYYRQEIEENYPNINKEREEYYPEQREQLRKTPIQMNQGEELNNQYNPKINNNKEEYNYGNEVPNSYEEYQRLMQKEYERENLLKQRQLNQENPNINNNMMNNIQLSKSQEEEFKQYQKEKAQIKNYPENIEMNEEQLKEKQREEAEAEYLQNVKKYEDIIQDNPEQRFKLPPPPFGSSNIPMKNKMSMESQMQGAEVGYINKMNQVSENPYSIDKYNLGESNLSQNPITHPVNSYQFDFRRLYNPLTNKNN